MSSQFDRVAWFDEWLKVLADGDNCHRFHVSFADVAEFLIDFSAAEIQVGRATSSLTIRQLLGDQILPRILAHQGGLVLHAGGVVNAEGAILLIGPSGSGKSSLAASLHNSGCRLVADDAIVITSSDGIPTARAVYRSLRLFPDSIAALVDGPAEQSPVAAYTTKQNIVYLDDRQTTDPVPIRAAFLLASPRGETVTIERMPASRACMAFVEHSFWMDPTDLTRTKKRVTHASNLAVSVPTFRLSYPRRYTALPAVHEAIAGIVD